MNGDSKVLWLNEQVFGGEHFGNNEAIYKEVELSKLTNVIKLKFENNCDITNLIIAAKYVKEEVPDAALFLDMYYVPYSGMDRKINDQLFSLKLFADIINSLDIDTVYAFDVHNQEVTSELFKNIVYVDIHDILDDVMDDFNPDILYYPDKGAFKKYMYTVDNRDLPVIHGNKVRDLENKGKIVSYETITNGIDITDKRILIVDDICRLGGTFAWAADELTKLGAKEIALYVSHCESGIFDGKILNDDSLISKVYTTDSQPAFLTRMKEKENEFKANKIKVYTL